MTAQLVECVPNFSEGRDPATIDALRAAIRAVPGVHLLDVQTDASHNRSVFTFVAPPATDVVPFVPVSGVTMEECVALAKTLGEQAARELAIPVFLYAKAAMRPEHERLPDIRKGEFEGLRERDLDPDFGPRRVHPTAGATAIGARPFLA